MAALHCPVCIETLQAPILMLTCGHNFCKTCLENIASQSAQIR